MALSRHGTVGFRSRASNKILDIEHCPVLTPVANQALSALRSLRLRTKQAQDIEFVANRTKAVIGVPTKFRKSVPSGSSNVRFTFNPSESNLFADDEKGPLRLAPGVFSQSNQDGNAALIEYVNQHVHDTAPLIELYAGSGNFTRYLTRGSLRLTTIEGAGPAVQFARESLPESVRILEGSVEKMLEEATKDLTEDVQILTDPPRTGMSPEVLEELLNLQPSRLIYVSCDPATFSRDAHRLSSVLELTRIKLFDLYPQTGHSEVVGVFTRR